MVKRFLVSIFSASVFFALMLTLFTGPSVQADTFDVPCDTDALIEAIEQAGSTSGEDTLNLAENCTYTLTNMYEADSGLPALTSTIRFVGNGATITRDEDAANFRLITIQPQGNITIENMTLSNGRGKLEGGAIFNWGTLLIQQSTIRNNSSDFTGGGIYTREGKLIVRDSLFTENRTSTDPGCSLCWGGAIGNFQSDVEIYQTTITGNTAGQGNGLGGGVGNSGRDGKGKMTIVDSTIVNNSANGSGGGIYARDDAIFGSELYLKNTIVANNEAPDAPDIVGTITSQGYNLISDSSGFEIKGNVSTNIYDVDPYVQLLANRGGTTRTIGLDSDSPAIDAGSCSSTVDQRGELRPVDFSDIENADNGCDIGAFEVQVLEPAPVRTNGPTDLNIGGGNTVSPTFNWTHQENEGDTTVPDEWYNLVVEREAVVLDEWYLAPQYCTGIICSVTPELELTDGTYSWYVRSWSQGVGFSYSAVETFTVDTDSIPSAGIIQKISPEADALVTGGSVDFVWNPDDNTSWYRLDINNTAGFSFQQWYEGAEICANDTCSVNRALPNGTFEWNVVGWGPGGMGSTGGPNSAIQFYVGVKPPSAIVTVSPSVGEALTATYGLDLVWQADPGAEYYRIYVSNGNNYTYDEWHEATSVCPTGQADDPVLCSLTGTLYPGNGVFSWYMVGWNSGGGMGTWNDGVTFAINSAKPAAIERIGPTGLTTTPLVTFTWNPASKAGWYQLYVLHESGYVFNQWVNARKVCISGDICQYRTGDLPEGEYRWWMNAWGPGGMGDWILTPFTFELQSEAPTVPEIISPEDGATVSPTFSLEWTLPQAATWFNVRLENAESEVASNSWLSRLEHCEGATCASTVTAEVGTYMLSLQAWGPGGFSEIVTRNIEIQ